MTVAGGSSTRLAYVAEVTYGVTPVNPAFKIINPTSHSLGLEKEGFQSETIRSDRQITDFRHGVRSVAGDIGTEFRGASLDDLLEAVMMGTWATDVLKSGTTRRSFTFERYFEGIGIFRRATGCEINTFSLDCPATGIIKATFGIIGQDEWSATEVLGGATYAADPNGKVMDSPSGSITVDGSAVTVITGVKLSLDNGIQNNAVVGETTKIRGAAGRSNVTGELTALYDSDALLDAFATEAEVAIVFTLTDGTATYTFTLPKVKFTGGKPEVGGEREISITIPFQALYDPVDTTQLKIER